jgi:hypothetical protein
MGIVFSGIAFISHPLDKLRLPKAQFADRDWNEAEIN